MRALSTRNDDPEAASRPFDAGRDGFVIGEGAGVVVLEALEHAEARGATILRRARRLRRDGRRLAHHAAGAGRDRRGPGGPDGRSRRPASTPADIDHVNAHATSTPEGDKAELQAIRTIFGDDAGRISITANKSMLGHTLGAAGAIEAIVSIQTIRDGCVPPTINLDDPDPEAAGLDLTPERRRVARDPGGASATRSGSAARTPPSSSGGATHDRRTPEAAVPEPEAPAECPSTTAATPSCSALIDRLAELLERSDLTELEVESGGPG